MQKLTLNRLSKKMNSIIMKNKINTFKITMILKNLHLDQKNLKILTLTRSIETLMRVRMCLVMQVIEEIFNMKEEKKMNNQKDMFDYFNWIQWKRMLI